KKPSPIKRLVEIRLDEFLVPARAINVPLPGRVKTTQELLERLEKLAKDDEVGAILLDLDGVALGIPDVEELRAGIAQFHKSGKKVSAFLNSGDPMDFLLACATDEIAVAPSGTLVIPGLGRIFPFMRGMYQMQGIEFDVITAGKFKYPGFVNRREPDKYFLEEFGEILDGWYDDYVKIIADGRKLSGDKVKKAIDQAIFDPEDAKNTGLVDVVAYYDEYRDRILRRDKFKKGREGESEWAQITSLQDLLTQMTKKMQEAQEKYKAVGPKIAVLHARGPIVDANAGAAFASSMIMRDEFVKSIEEIRKNKTIRAVVLHIDSPGGSAYASDVIWRKLRQLDDEKPLVVCMGNVAGSGGYYIACPGRLIFAQPSTLTGSIGVLAILPNQASMLNRRDVNIVEMKRGERSLLGSGHRDLRPEDRELIQKYILKTYEQFLDRVAATRKIPKDQLRKLAEGRIYTGRQAMDIGLVDRIGSLKDAVEAVRDMADIPPSAEVKLVHYPRAASIGELAESLFGMSTMTQAMMGADAPAPAISFDSQLRYFAREPKPLCWMAVPEIQPAWGFDRPRPATLDVLDLLNGNAAPREAPVLP
ncbi:MAG TPA: signal peptide peptidase SppA, partial [Phycisphaerae bacterium]|nr:signal peptide peptidase SppA [Phycisphaerae bacterium]